MNDISKTFELVDDDDAIRFLHSLIQINSVTLNNNEKEVADFIKDRLHNKNLCIASDEVGENRENLSVSYKSEKYKKESNTLIFSGHFDTVPPGNVEWNYPIFGGERADNKIFGRGATDMKSGVAAMIVALEAIQKAQIPLSGELRFIGTVGEEVDCIGAKMVVEKGRIDDATAIVVGEPTANEVMIAHKGVLWLQVTIFGKTAHGSMPSQGINAILGMNHFINELVSYPIQYEHHSILGESTINIGTIHGGVSTNVVPDQCTMNIDIRTVPGQKHEKLISEINKILEKITNKIPVSYQVETLNDLACVHTSSEHPFIKLAKETSQDLCKRETASHGGVNYYTDASVYRKHLREVPILIYGPGEPTIAHQPDEWVDIENYLAAIRYYITLAIKYLK